MAVHPQVGGRWLADICPFGDLTWSTSWLGGLDTFSWAVPLGQFPELRRGVAVVLRDGGLSLGVGTITEVSPGEVHGEGLWRMADGTPALDGSGNPTANSDTAVDQAIARGDLPGWSRPAALLPGGSMATPEAETAVSVAEVLTRLAEHTTSVPYIDTSGGVRLRGLPAVPTWQTTPPDGKLTTASDEYATHLVAAFYVSAGVGDSRTYGDATAAARWGRVTKPVDLRPLGVIATGTVDAILAGMLAKGMARPTWAGTLEVTSTELTTLGGTPANLATVEAGQGVRLQGTFDDSRLVGGYSYTDITADRVEYVDGAATARITPVGFTPRDLKGLFTVALEGAA